MAKRHGLKGTQIEEVEDDDIDFELENPNKIFGSHSNLIPLQSAVAAPRVFYGARFINQAVPLSNPDAPLVQALQRGSDKSFEELYGDHAGNVRSKVGGKVKKVTPDYIEVIDDKGESHTYDLYNNFSYNRNTAITNKPVIEAGAAVTPGQLLAHSNYTAPDGTLALGKNALVGIVPYKGLTMDDAIVISEKFAKDLTSEQLKTINFKLDKNVKSGKNHFISLFSNLYNKDQLAKLDDDGVVQVGQTVNKDDPLILTTAPRVISSADQKDGKLARHMLNARRNSTTLWDQDAEGIVTDVTKTRSGIKINIASRLPAQEGDKIVARQGAKGVISRIIPDAQMPRREDGTPLDVLLNPLSIVSRVNDALPYEIMLGKVAALKGKPYKLDSFQEGNWYDLVEKELKDAGVSDTERVYDPQLDKYLDNPITVGNAYVLKLSHMAKSKQSGRNLGGYSVTDQSPLKGGGEGAQSKRISGLETAALLGSGAYATLREVATLRGTRNDDYWRKLRQGESPNMPREPFAWDKFRALISGSGLHTTDNQGKLRLGPFTDKILDSYNPKEVKSGLIVDNKTLAPVKDGLFDNVLNQNNRWGYIPLDFPVPNPAYEMPIQKLLGLTKKDLMGVMQGTVDLNGKTGPKALQEALKSIDLDKMEAEAKETLAQNKKTKRPLAVDRLNIIQGLKRNGVTPDELIITKVPVIPTKFRPFSMTGDMFMPGDANELYRDLIDTRDAYRMSEATFGEAGDDKQHVYDAVKAVYGYGEPVNSKTKERGVSGFLQKLVGDSPKTGWLQRRLLSKTTDLSGRGVATVDPEYKLDEIGMPEDLAWKQYQPFIQRRLVQEGLKPSQAVLEIRDRTDRASKALDREMSVRPVMYSRSPVWHKFGIIGGWAKRVKGKNIVTNPYITTGQTLDYDGDTINLHVPATAEAVNDIKDKLMPSKMLFTIRDEDKVMPQPKMETLLGLYEAKHGKGKPVVFNSKAEAIRAIARGDVSLSDDIVIGKAASVQELYRQEKQADVDMIKESTFGAGVLFPMDDGKYLLERNSEDHTDKPNKLRPAGGGMQARDKCLRDTILRELEEEFKIDPEVADANLELLGYHTRGMYTDCALFELKNHGLSAGKYQASNSKSETVELEPASLMADDYVGWNPKSLRKPAKLDVNKFRRKGKYPAWIGVDLDGTLAETITPFNPKLVGAPIPKMFKRVKDLLEQGWVVKIFTARAAEGSTGVIRNWMKVHGLPELEITNAKDPGMVLLYDDKAVHIQENTGVIKKA
jgi:hypothetical protein